MQIEIDIFVDLSPRQRALYAKLLANVSVADLLEKAANIGDADSARSLMNLVMQFRKVRQALLCRIEHWFIAFLRSVTIRSSSRGQMLLRLIRSVNTENRVACEMETSLSYLIRHVARLNFQSLLFFIKMEVYLTFLSRLQHRLRNQVVLPSCSIFGQLIISIDPFMKKVRMLLSVIILLLI